MTKFWKASLVTQVRFFYILPSTKKAPDKNPELIIALAL